MKTVEQIEAELSDLGSSISMWKSLMEHPGWVALMKLANAQMSARTQLCMNPLTGINAALPAEHMKGEVSGINLFCGMPAQGIELAESDRTRLNVQLEQEKDRVAETSKTDEPRSRVEDEQFSVE
jgi:hypothetical protein